MRRNAVSSLPICGLFFVTIALSGCGGVVPSTLLSKSYPLVTVQGVAQVHAGGASQYTADAGGKVDTSVTWAVNGTAGGSSSLGSIDVKGNYSAPSTVPKANVVVISATDTTSHLVGSVNVTLLQLMPVISSANLISADGGKTGTLTVDASSLGASAVVLVNGANAGAVQGRPGVLTATVTSLTGVSSVLVAVQNSGAGAQTSAQQTVPVQVIPTSAHAAARFLSQSTFGFNAGMIQQVEQSGMYAFLAQQFAEPASLIPPVPTTLPAWTNGSAFYFTGGNWWNNVFTGNDQLRQRVALALSEIFVVSESKVNPRYLPLYNNTLAQDAFGNWRTLMKDVTLTAAMGDYLDMWYSAKPAAGQLANENFARESMQLFNLGVNQINMDGSLVLDANGNPIPNYTDANVQAFARAYTGWWPQTSATDGGYNEPLLAVASRHDTNAKTLLNGTVLPAGQTAEEDLDGALDNVFAQSSLPPFLSKQLIQHLVTSNPSPAYVERVANVFVNDGTGVRGNLQAVVQAILMDPEARAMDDPNVSSADFGHLQEPVLWLSHVIIGIGYTGAASVPASSWLTTYNATADMGQAVQTPPSVFSYFTPQTLLPGSDTLLAPEFGLENTSSIASRLDVTSRVVDGVLTGLSMNLTATSSWGQLAATPPALLDQINLVFFDDSMSANLRQTILNAITPMPDMAERARTAIYLAVSSPSFKIRQ